jgi:hypothetical protein
MNPCCPGRRPGRWSCCLLAPGSTQQDIERRERRYCRIVGADLSKLGFRLREWFSTVRGLAVAVNRQRPLKLVFGHRVSFPAGMAMHELA